VLLARGARPQDWAKQHLHNATGEIVHSL
jgi:hypothetical protein